METSLFYLLRVSIAATILYLFFKFILSKRTFHAINRIVVLSVVVMTLVLPLFTVQLPEISFFKPNVETVTTQPIAEEMLADLDTGSYSNTPSVTPTPANVEIPWLKILGVMYLIGFSIALLRFAISFIRMSRIIYQTKKVQLDDNSMLCISDKKVSPFSWMKYIVLSRVDFEADSQAIIRHEQAHVAFGHSYDLLFLDLYSLVFWFNPFAWLLRLELQTTHEYQADEKVLAEGANAQNYHLSLIRQCVGDYKFALANNFEYNNLHKRIKMTMKTKSSSNQKWLYGTIGLSVMLCIVVLSFNGLKATASNLKEMIKSEISDSAKVKKGTTKFAKQVIKTKKTTAKSNVKSTPSVVTTNQTPLMDEKAKDGFLTMARELSKSTEPAGNYKMPQFNGGNMALINYISKNVIYPSDALEKKIQGIVLVKLSVNEQGKVTKAEIGQGVDPSLNKEAIRVANTLPDFIPGEVDGKKASLTYMLPISFRIDKDNKPDVKGLAVRVSGTKILDQIPLSEMNGLVAVNSKLSPGMEKSNSYRLPQFPGGQSELLGYIRKHVVYSSEVLEKEIQGEVTVRITVNELGRIKTLELIQGVDPSLDKEIFRIARTFPNFVPGEVNDKKASLSFDLQMNFKLDKIGKSNG